jgi:hypothetical protein
MDSLGPAVATVIAWFTEPVRIGRVIVPGPSFEEDYLAHRVQATVGQAITAALPAGKSDPVSPDTVWTTMTAVKEAGHEGQGAKADHDSWQ